MCGQKVGGMPARVTLAVGGFTVMEHEFHVCQPCMTKAGPLAAQLKAPAFIKKILRAVWTMAIARWGRR